MTSQSIQHSILSTIETILFWFENQNKMVSMMDKIEWFAYAPRIFVSEMFDRNVRWIIDARPQLANTRLNQNDRLDLTFAASLTSLRLLMFQVCFLHLIGSNSTTDALDKYSIFSLDHLELKQVDNSFGIPSTRMKETLQIACKEILLVNSWSTFLQRVGLGLMSSKALYDWLVKSIGNSARKQYHKRRY